MERPFCLVNILCKPRHFSDGIWAIFLFMKIRNTLHFSDEIQEFCSDNYKIKKKINFTVVIYLQNWYNRIIKKVRWDSWSLIRKS